MSDLYDLRLYTIEIEMPVLDLIPSKNIFSPPTSLSPDTVLSIGGFKISRWDEGVERFVFYRINPDQIISIKPVSNEPPQYFLEK